MGQQFRRLTILGPDFPICSTMVERARSQNRRWRVGFQGMRSSLARRATTLLLAQSLLCSIVFGQQQSREESRPRRAQAEWPQPPAASSPIPATIITPMVGAEPNIRVALVTDARSATISTASRLMNATGGGTTVLRLDAAPGAGEPHPLA